MIGAVPTSWRGLVRWPGSAAHACIVLAAGAVIGALLTGGAAIRLAIVGTMAVLALGVWTLRPRALFYVLVLWTAELGLVRRLVSYDLVSNGSGTDPLLVVLPFLLLLLAAAGVGAGALRRRTRLANGVNVLTGLVFVGALNPLQGSLTAGIVSLVFFIPLVAFWAGRKIDDDVLRRVMTLVAVLAVGAALYGFGQLILGFPTWDEHWLAEQGYTAIRVGSVVRPFASFSAASEYATFLALGTLLWLWLRPLGVRKSFAVIPVVLLAVALVYASGRGIVFALIGTLGLLLATRRRLGLVSAPIAFIGAVLLLPFVVSRVAPAPSPAAVGPQVLVSHQLQGLGDPTGNTSTLGGHFALVLDGIKSAFTHPLGRGISLVTIAGAKFGGVTAGSEADVSNAALAMGLPGLLAYLFVFYQAFTRGYRVAVARGDPLSLAALGVISLTVLQWLNGGQYAVAYLSWLAIGWIDARSQEIDPATA